MKDPLKDYKKSFDFILNKIRVGENFAFARFSDGELGIGLLYTAHYILGPTLVEAPFQVHAPSY